MSVSAIEDEVVRMRVLIVEDCEDEALLLTHELERAANDVSWQRVDSAEAMKRALDLKPDAIYFLTDGAFDEDLVDKLRQWNRVKKVRIYTIGYLYTTGEYEERLRRIASENGGSYRFVDSDN